MKVAVTLAAIVVAVVAAWIGFHAWWVDTHCTTVLGTQVCQAGGSQPQPAPAPATVAQPPSQPQGLPGSVLVGKGGTHPPGRADVYCLAGQPTAAGLNGELYNGTYLQLYGPVNGWFIDHDDPQNSPCR